MATQSKDTTLVDALTDGRFLAAVGLLALNDHLLKEAWPSWWTGKVSDLAGMVVFPVVLAALATVFGFSANAVIRRWSLAIAGGFLLSIKTVPAAARATETALAAITGWQQQIVVDPTDLLGLGGLLIAWRIMVRPHPLVGRRAAGRLALGAAMLACVATSEAQYPTWSQIDEQDGVLVANSPGWNSRVWVSSDGGRSWVEQTVGDTFDRIEPRLEGCLEREPERCFRIDAKRVLETDDGGTTWSLAWFVDDDEAWVERQLTVETSQPRVEPLDLVITDEDIVVVAMGSIAPIHREIDGRWQPSPTDLRSFPGGWVFLAVGLVVLGLGLITFVRLRSRYAGTALVSIGGALTISGFPIMLAADSFDAFGWFAVTVAAGVLIATVAAIIKGYKWATRSQAVHEVKKAPERSFVWSDFAAMAVAIPATALPHVAWNLGWIEWNAATGLLVLAVGVVLALQVGSMAAVSSPAPAPVLHIEPPPPMVADPLPLPLFLALGFATSIAAVASIQFLVGVAVLMLLAVLIRRQGLDGAAWKARVLVVVTIGITTFIVEIVFGYPFALSAAAVASSWLVLLVPLGQPRR